MGIPIYAAINPDADQFPSRKTWKPVTKVMVVAPMNPYHAVYGWKGDLQGTVSRLTPWASLPAWKRT